MPWTTPSDEWLKKAAEINARYGLTSTDEHTLAIYNSERERGIMHTPEWQQQMSDLQARFEQRKAEHNAMWDRAAAAAKS